MALDRRALAARCAAVKNVFLVGRAGQAKHLGEALEVTTFVERENEHYQLGVMECMSELLRVQLACSPYFLLYRDLQIGRDER